MPRPNSAPYTATKHAITGLTRSTSLDGRKYDIACGQIDVGNADTEPMARVHTGVMQAHGALASEPTMDVKDVARMVICMASLPLEANVQFMTVMATKMPFIGRGRNMIERCCFRSTYGLASSRSAWWLSLTGRRGARVEYYNFFRPGDCPPRSSER